MQNIQNTMFLAYYEFLQRQGIDYANVLNFTGLTLNKLNLENSLYFKQIKRTLQSGHRSFQTESSIP